MEDIKKKAHDDELNKSKTQTYKFCNNLRYK